MTDPVLFGSGREFTAFPGLVPRQRSSGGKDRLSRISRMGDGYLRKLPVVGVTTANRRARTGASPSTSWINALLKRRPGRVVTAGHSPIKIATAPGPRPELQGCTGDEDDDLNAAAGQDSPNRCRSLERDGLIGPRLAGSIRACGHQRRASSPDR